MEEKANVKGGGKLWSNSPAMPVEHGTSAPQNTSVGSGSRPTASKFKIGTTAPEDPHTQGRSVPGALK